MAEYRFERECRTPYSESYSVESDSGDDVARVDLHLTNSGAYATLCVSEGLTEDDIQDLIGQIDERLVMTSDPYREDFVVTVWTGRETGVYSDEDDEDDEEEDGEHP
jgi:TATA-binding protein-associated factor Taf7